MTAGHIEQLDEATFDDRIARGIWLVDFWAEWCQPCHALHAVLEDIAGEGPEGVTIGRVAVTDEPELASRFEVSSVPTVLVFKDGVVQRRLFGAKNRRQVLGALDAVRRAG